MIVKSDLSRKALLTVSPLGDVLAADGVGLGIVVGIVRDIRHVLAFTSWP